MAQFVHVTSRAGRAQGRCPPRVGSAAIALAFLLLLCGPGEGRGGTLVQLQFQNFGSVYVDLLDSVAPISAANFLQYVNAGRYDNSMIHRKTTVAGDGLGVVQGGGYDAQADPIATFAPIALEYHLSNARGTLGMARLVANPNSATSQWFFNTSDNSPLLGPPNPSYAVFGWVLGGGMSAIDAIGAIPRYNFGGPLSQLPLVNYTQQDFENGVDPQPHFVVLNDVSIVSVHPSFQNPIDRWDVNNNGIANLQDLGLITNHLITYGPHVMDASYVGTSFQYLDTNGDGWVSELDLVPEPSSLALAILGTASVLTAGIRSRRKRA
jgi:cyclophilin family peptidyl-prolyl cis-trans isomerase